MAEVAAGEAGAVIAGRSGLIPPCEGDSRLRSPRNARYARDPSTAAPMGIT